MKDANNTTATSVIAVKVSPALQVTTSSSNNPATAGVAFTMSATASGGTPPYTFGWTGTLPGTGASVTVNPSVGGPVYETVNVTDSAGAIGVGQLQVNVNAPTLVQVGTAPSQAYATSPPTLMGSIVGGTGPYHYPWTGTVSGTAKTMAFTPPAANTYPETLTVTDANGAVGTDQGVSSSP